MKLITLIAEKNYAREAVRIYKRLGSVYFWHALSSAERRKMMARANILVVRLAFDVTAQVIRAMPSLKLIATSTTGLNHVDMSAAEARKIQVISLRGHTDFLKNIPSTAEETMGLMLALLRNIPWAFEDVQRGRWRTNHWAGHELRGKTLALIGVGRLGTLVARYARAFRMRVVGVDPHVSVSRMRRLGVRKVSLQQALRDADVVSLHVLLTQKTSRMISRRHFRAMKRNGIFINTARAELIEKGALHDALRKKWIAGAAIDVLDGEQSTGGHLKKNPLVAYAKKNKNLIIMPHVGGTTSEAMETTQVFIAHLVERAVRTGERVQRI